MKYQEYLRLGFVLLSIISSQVNASTHASGPPAYGEATNILPASLTGQELGFQRWLWAHERRTDAAKGTPAGAYLRAFEQIQTSKAAARTSYATQNEQWWVSIGPSPLLGGQIVSPEPPDVMVNGRVVDIAVDPSNTNHWFIAGDYGGIWETLDAGINWTPRTDDQPAMGMSALAIAPGNHLVIYGGTKDIDGTGSGFLRSTNGGFSWTFLPSPIFASGSYFNFTALRVSPSNSSVLVTTTWDFFGPTPSTGLFKSTNGGTTWLQKLAGVGTALAVNPLNFSQQYAGLRTVYPGFDGASNGVYRSLDAGDTWQNLNGPWGVVNNDGNGVLLAVAPSNPNVAYVCISGQSLWRSSNAWVANPSWTSLPLPPSEPGVDKLIVDSANASVLYAGGVSLWKLTGGTWSDVTGTTHVDQHALAWVGSKLILGNDGGLWTSVNGGASWSNHNATLGLTQLYRGALHPTNANFALAGSQDNGAEKWLGTNTWKWIFPGDDFSCAIANNQPDSRWAICYYYLGIQRTLDGGANYEAADGGIEQTNRPFYSLFVKSPVNDDIFITATSKLWKTTNFFSGAPVLWSTNGPDMGNLITAMTFAGSDLTGSTYAFGTQNGDLRLTTNGGLTWKDMDMANAVPGRTVTGLAFGLSNANVLYLTLSGFDDFGPAGHVFKTTNALAANPTWTNVSPPANLPHNTVVADGPNGEAPYIGTDMGVWRSTNSGGSWVHMGPEVGMPNVVVNDLQLNPANGRLVAFTYGRGAFALVNTTNFSDISFSEVKISGLDVLLTFSTVLGRTYFLQRSDEVQPSGWSTIATNLAGTGNSITVRDTGGTLHPRRFYRAVVHISSGPVNIGATSGVITAPFIITNGYIYQPAETGLSNGGRAAYNFTITNAGNYVIQAVVNAPGDGANSFFVNIDAEPQDPFMIWDITPFTSGFAQRTVSWRGNGTFDNNQYVPKVFNLSQGAHQLIIRGREAATFLQRIAITPIP